MNVGGGLAGRTLVPTHPSSTVHWTEEEAFELKLQRGGFNACVLSSLTCTRFTINLVKAAVRVRDFHILIKLL
jgi:hypothetical protein